MAINEDKISDQLERLGDIVDDRMGEIFDVLFKIYEVVVDKKPIADCVPASTMKISSKHSATEDIHLRDMRVQLKTSFTTLFKIKGEASCKTLLNTYGTDKVSMIKDHDLISIIRELEGLLGGENEQPDKVTQTISEGEVQKVLVKVLHMLGQDEAKKMLKTEDVDKLSDLNGAGRARVHDLCLQKLEEYKKFKEKRVEKKAVNTSNQSGQPSQENVIQALVDLTGNKDRETALGVLKSFGARKVNDLKPSQYAAVIVASNIARGD